MPRQETTTKNSFAKSSTPKRYKRSSSKARPQTSKSPQKHKNSELRKENILKVISNSVNRNEQNLSPAQKELYE